VTTYTYSPAGPLTITESVTSTETRTTSMAYNAQGQPTSITDARGKTTSMAYNTSGDLVSVTDPLSHATEFGYDAMGRRTTVTDPLDNTTTTTYDAQGRVTRVTSPDGTHTDFTYDAAGRRTTVTDPMGRTTGYIYDAYGRLEKVVDPAGGVTSYGYDLMSRLTSLTDAKGQTTLFEYDAHGRMTKMTYPGGAFETFAYDAAGRLTTKTDRKGIVTTYSYDGFGRLTGKTYSDGTPPVTYTYHPQSGRLLTAANGTDTLSWTYDLAGQLLTEQSSRNASTVAYTYDAGGNRLTLSLDGQLFVSYAYDDASRLTSITRGANVFSFGYDPASRRTSMSYPNGVVTSYTYDMLSRLTRLKADKGATPITDFQYTYDPSGNRTRKQQLDYTEDYGYDELYRLTTVSRNNGANYWGYSYDAVGNRLTSQADQSVTSSVYNEKNQLLTSAGGGPLRVRGQLDEPGTAVVNGVAARMLAGNVFEAEVPAAPGANTISVTATDLTGNVTTKGWTVNVPSESATYAYDANGNLTNKTDSTGNWTYDWNAENQLIRVTKDGSDVARFTYDPLGRRVEKVAGGTTTTWVYDAEDILRGSVGSSTYKYVHGPDLDEPLAREDSPSVFSFEHGDGVGSRVKTTNSVGVVTLTRQYDAWGNLEQGAAAGGYAFTGREWDLETELYYYRARYYDSKTGAFISEDPVNYRDGLSLYSYALSNPVKYVDPLGLTASPPPQPPKAPKCDPECPGPVQQAANNLCANVDKITEVDIRRCVASQCNAKPPLPIGCIDLCPPKVYGITSPGGDKIAVCPANHGGPGKPCLELTIAHEITHVCRAQSKAGSPKMDPDVHANVTKAVQQAVPCPFP
jgi:RHS repeat-associated protein